jgi:hypothetical protein
LVTSGTHPGGTMTSPVRRVDPRPAPERVSTDVIEL